MQHLLRDGELMRRLLVALILIALGATFVWSPASAARGRLRHGTPSTPPAIQPPPPPPTVLCPPAGVDPALVRYASQNGGGDGMTVNTPYLVTNFMSQATEGWTLCLRDDIYSGSASALKPPAGRSGTNGNPIRVIAINDGAATFDGGYARIPVEFANTNNWWHLEGFNARRSSYHAMQLCGSNHVVKRVVAHDAAMDSNATTFIVCDGGNNTLEDIAIFGAGRYSFAFFQSANNTVRRLWARWEGSTNTGPKITMSLGYGDTGSWNNRCENCIATWRPISMPQNYVVVLNAAPTGECNAGGAACSNFAVYQRAGLLRTENNAEADGNRLYGSMAYIRESDWVANLANPIHLVASFLPGSQVYEHVIAANTLGGGHNNIPFVFELGHTSGLGSNTLTHATSVSNPTNNSILGSKWTVTDLVSATTPGGAPSPWTGTTGGQMCFRWTPGGTSASTTPLWPWPMDSRIAAAVNAAGAYTGPCLSCSGGRQSRTGTIVSVTADVEGIFGTIPSPCKQ